MAVVSGSSLRVRTVRGDSGHGLSGLLGEVTGGPVRVMTYNIRHAQGMDGWLSNARVANVIRDAAPDVVGLNEVWHMRGIFDQPRLLGELLGMKYAYEANHVIGFHTIGNVVLTPGSIRSHTNMALPGGLEGRGCLSAEVEVGGAQFLFASTHLSLGRRARGRQIAALAEGLPDCVPLVLAGDLNCPTEELGPLAERFVVIECPPPTYPSVRPRRALDHIVLSRHWELVGMEALDSKASDHRPLVAELRIVTSP
jgi:endonuclease/exonuclease/phosphatase family metal-dependent hydrolase